MAPISRREFLKTTTVNAATAGVVAAGLAVRLRAYPNGWPIGSRIYPHQAMLGDFPGFCKMMAAIGVTRLELCSPLGYKQPAFAVLRDATSVKQIMADHGIKSESGHFSLPELRENQQASIDWAKAIGMTQMMVASLGDGHGGSNPTLDQVKKAADEYNAIGAVAAKNGIQQGLHNEGFELSMVDGVRTYDRLFDLLDPKLVKFQFQMSTITAGLVATEYFAKHPGRFISMHVQDIDMMKTTPGRGGRGPGHPQVAVGSGSDRLGPDVRRRQGHRRQELLRRAELGPHEGERRVPEGARSLIDAGERCPRPEGA